MNHVPSRAIGALVVGRFSADERRLIYWLLHNDGILAWRDAHEAMGRDSRSPKLYTALASLLRDSVLVKGDDGRYSLAEPEGWSDRFDDCAAALLSRASLDGEARVRASGPRKATPAGADWTPPRYRFGPYLEKLRKAREAIAAAPVGPAEAKPKGPTFDDVASQIDVVFGVDAVHAFFADRKAIEDEFGGRVDYLSAAVRTAMKKDFRIGRPVPFILGIARRYKAAGEIPDVVLADTSPLVAHGLKASKRKVVVPKSIVDLVPTGDRWDEVMNREVVKSSEEKWKAARRSYQARAGRDQAGVDLNG